MLQYITMCQALFDTNHNKDHTNYLRGQTIYGTTNADVCGRRCKKIINKFPWTHCVCVDEKNTKPNNIKQIQ